MSTLIMSTVFGSKINACMQMPTLCANHNALKHLPGSNCYIRRAKKSVTPSRLTTST